MITDLVASALIAAVPLVLAAIGGALQRQSGVVSIGLESQMLAGALFAVLGSAASGSWLIGVAAGAAAGALVGVLMSLFITRLHGNEIIVGLAMNIAVAGAIGFVLRGVVGVSGTIQPDGLVQLPPVVLPGIAAVPFVGPVLSAQTPLFWFAVLTVPAAALLLRHTSWGVRLRATGVSEAGARSLGIRTASLRDGVGALAGALSGIGGAALSLGAVGLFSEDMTAGRGYVALAAFYFGRSRPLPTALVCVLFGLFEALQITLQTGSTGYANLLGTLPYVAVVVALAAAGVAESRRRTRRIV